MENDYILSANAYNPYIGEEEKDYKDPQVALMELDKIFKELGELKKDLHKKLGK